MAVHKLTYRSLSGGPVRCKLPLPCCVHLSLYGSRMHAGECCCSIFASTCGSCESYRARGWNFQSRRSGVMAAASAACCLRAEWGDGGGVSNVLPASGVERLCRLRAVVTTSFDAFLLSRRVPVSLSPCSLFPCLPLSLLPSVSSSSPTVCFSSSSRSVYSHARFVVTSRGSTPLSNSPSTVLPWFFLLPVHAYVTYRLFTHMCWSY